MYILVSSCKYTKKRSQNIFRLYCVGAYSSATKQKKRETCVSRFVPPQGLELRSSSADTYKTKRRP